MGWGWAREEGPRGLTGAAQQHPRRGRQGREGQLRVRARAVARDEDVAEEARALAHRAQHGRGRVGGQLVGGVQQQVVPEDAGGAQLALVQSGARVRGGGGGVGGVGGRWRDEQRLRPVPELFLVRQALEGLLGFGHGRLMLLGEFLEREERSGSNPQAFPTGHFHRLKEGERLF